MQDDIHYVNDSGRDLAFFYQGQKFLIKAWRHIDLPNEMTEFLETREIPLSINYERYLNDEEFAKHDEFLNQQLYPKGYPKEE